MSLHKRLTWLVASAVIALIVSDPARAGIATATPARSVATAPSAGQASAAPQT
jgi:hypothetical protein